MKNLKSLPPYRRESQWHPDNPARCPVGAARTSIPLGWPPSLHPLRGRQHWTTWVEPIADTVVRGLRRYYGTIRLPTFVHHRRASLDFPMRPAQSPGSGERGISRFSREGRDRARARAYRWRVSIPALSITGWVHSSTMATFPSLPLKFRT